MDDVAPEQARSALDTVERARREIADEIGLPRGYWWAMAAGWVVLGVLGDVLPSWAAGMATVVFSAGHTAVASRLLDGRRRTDRLRVSAAVAGRRVPLVVVGMLAGLVLVTVAAALALDADGADHAGIWATVLVAAVVGFGGPEILRVLRRWVRA
ncbi:hypothetical protein ACFO3J_35155 [Streptomyces polygonati]|uniref:Uncharacterized protein n=1 Tax=Streptomyces polygonati TaxID=1617087 RepID=A0ABV8I0B5_9ACTN